MLVPVKDQEEFISLLNHKSILFLPLVQIATKCIFVHKFYEYLSPISIQKLISNHFYKSCYYWAFHPIFVTWFFGCFCWPKYYIIVTFFNEQARQAKTEHMEMKISQPIFGILLVLTKNELTKICNEPGISSSLQLHRIIIFQ